MFMVYLNDTSVGELLWHVSKEGVCVRGDGKMCEYGKGCV